MGDLWSLEENSISESDQRWFEELDRNSRTSGADAETDTPIGEYFGEIDRALTDELGIDEEPAALAGEDMGPVQKVSPLWTNDSAMYTDSSGLGGRLGVSKGSDGKVFVAWEGEDADLDSLDPTRHGDVTVQPGDETVYSIDNESYNGCELMCSDSAWAVNTGNEEFLREVVNQYTSKASMAQRLEEHYDED